MKYLKSIAAVLVLMIAATGSAGADHGHLQRHPGHFHSHHNHFRSHVFVGIGGGPYWDPWYFYPPPLVYSSPPVYVEQLPGPASPAGNYWYYCADSGRYYPYVAECPGGWQRVVPAPPDFR